MIYSKMKERRLALGMSQKSVAAKAGISQQKIAQIESGAFDIQLSTFMRILAALNIDNTKIQKLLCDQTEGVILEPEATIREM